MQLVKKCIYLGIFIKFVLLECSVSLWLYDLWTP